MGVERHSSTFIKAGLVLASSALLLACSDQPDPAVMDTGLPLTEGLKAYDVDRYVLDHEILPEKKAIAGASTIEFTAATQMTRLELDFDGRFKVESVEAAGAELTFEKTPTKLYVDLAAPLQPGESAAVTVRYHGKPVEAERAPWDGGFVWSKSPSGKPWIATAFQGEGCDVWFPCKDHPLGEPRKGAEFFYTVPAGLTAAGKALVRRCNELGILVDLSHLTEAGFWDVAALSDQPLVASHSNAHALCPTARNLTDRQLAAIRETGGLVGLNFATAFLRADGSMRADVPLTRMVEHLDHLLDHLGEDGVGLGSDYDGAVVPHALSSVEHLPRLRTAMAERGYGDALIEKICHGNWLRVLKATWGA